MLVIYRNNHVMNVLNYLHVTWDSKIGLPTGSRNNALHAALLASALPWCAISSMIAVLS